MVDNGSVYTPHLVNFLESTKTPFYFLEFDKVDVSKLGQYDSYILSGRRKNNQKMNAVNSKIVKDALSGGKPVLGICYGAEILALTLGSTIRKMSKTEKGSRKVTIFGENPLFGGKQMDVFESHSYEISKIPASLQVLGGSETCKAEIIQVCSTNIFGVQFHPEMSKDGLALIGNFCSL